MKKYFIAALILLGLTGCDIPFSTYKLIVEGKTLEIFETKDECEKRAKKLNFVPKGLGFDRIATCEISFFKND